MYCPNCGSRNAKRQNYCRYCGLQIDEIGKKLATQLALGKETESFRRLRNVRILVDGAQVFFAAVALVGLMIWAFFDGSIGRLFLGIGLGSLIFTEVVRALTRRSMSAERAGHSGLEGDPSSEIRFLEERDFEPASSVTEDATRLLADERRQRR